MKVVAVIQARMGSSRLPGKVLETIGVDGMGRPLPAYVHTVERTRLAVPDTVLAIPASGNNLLAMSALLRQIPVVQGPEDDVLARYVLAAREHDADVIVRVTSDCPFIDPDVIRWVARLVTDDGFLEVNYASNVHPRTFPKGLDVEAFTRDFLERANVEATEPYDREHVTPWMVRTQNADRTYNVQFLGGKDYSHHRWTLDTPEDLEFFRTVAEHLDVTPPRPTTSELLDLLTEHPEIAEINQ
jgi:spore coat polysaccharide biosynthesis protein SpsF